MLAAHAIVLALYDRERTGVGQYLDLSMYDTMIGLAERSISAYSLTGHVLERGREPYMAPWGPFECRDGWVALIVATEGDWEKFSAAIDRPDLVGKDGATSGPERAKSMNGWLGEIIRDWFKARTKDEAVTRLLGVGLPIGPVQDAKEVFECRHAAAREKFIEVHDPVLGPVKLVGPAIKMSRTPTPPARPAPRLGEHTDELLRDLLGFSEERVAALKAQGIF
jgi:crotonobetainyl-CoA:carnitine CoA-transferase CaiB-like acyl-CoA transferase